MAERPKTPKAKEPAAAKAKPKGGAAAKAAAALPPPPKAEVARAVVSDQDHKTHSFRRRLLGKVVSNKMQKTVVVEVIRRSRDSVYKKYVRHRARYKAHDERSEFRLGDQVEIMEHRPISKDKRWKVVRLVSRSVEE